VSLATVPPSEPAFTDGGPSHPTPIAVAGPWITPLIGGVLLLTVGLLGTTGNPLLAALPLLAGLAGIALWWLPIRIPLLLALGVGVLADVTGPVPVPGSDPVLAPFRWFRLLLLENLNTLTGIGALRFSGLDVVLVTLTVLLLLRVALATPEDVAAPARPLAPLLGALVAAFVVLMLAEMWGLARGGDGRQSFWQIRYLLWTPVLATLSMIVLRRMGHLVELALLLTGVAVVKVAVGVYVYIWSLRHGHGVPHSVTSHADTMLFAVVIALWSAILLLRPTATRLLVGLPVLAAMLLGIVVNNRRTAYVSVAVAMVLLFVHLPSRTRRLAALALLAISPLASAYLLAGKSGGGGIFAPAAAVWSVTTQQDASSDSRDVENYNLTLTIRKHLPLGAGFGHPYDQGPSAYDLSEIFEQFQFVAHNSVLWLLGILGPVGFSLVWMPLVVGTFFAARSHRLAETSSERIAAYTVIATFAIYQLQAWADMGTQGWTGTTLVALAFGTTAVLARRTDAWPRPEAPTVPDVTTS
jgi:hypothetical protein